MNHKRHRAKNQRAGCLFCKPHKANGAGQKALTVQDLRAPVIQVELAEYDIEGARFQAPPDQCSCFYGLDYCDGEPRPSYQG